MSCDQKKGWESNCQFDFWPLKVKNRHDFCACRWHAIYHWKAFDKGYNLALDFISIEGLQKEVMGLQGHKSLNFEDFGTPSWESRDKMTFGCWPYGQAQKIL
jgi:hypothetical protein